MNIRSVWATTATRETFSTAERYECVEDCAEIGQQYLAAQARVGHAFYEYPDGAVLVVVVRQGLVSTMTGVRLESE